MARTPTAAKNEFLTDFGTFCPLLRYDGRAGKTNCLRQFPCEASPAPCNVFEPFVQDAPDYLNQHDTTPLQAVQQRAIVRLKRRYFRIPTLSSEIVPSLLQGETLPAASDHVCMPFPEWCFLVSFGALSAKPVAGPADFPC
ncbi:MAG: hypothetical protein O9248_00310 [Rhodobacteraceae bacterium]|nr:hypothetical protein [Paracoccaceae bacterium]